MLRYLGIQKPTVLKVIPSNSGVITFYFVGLGIQEGLLSIRGYFAGSIRALQRIYKVSFFGGFRSRVKGFGYRRSHSDNPGEAYGFGFRV